MASRRQEYTSKWLESNESYLAGLQEDCGGNTGFSALLYQQCLTALRDLCCRAKDKAVSTSVTSQLENEVTRLYLWGEYFQNGKLAIALQASEDVETDAIELLRSIGRAILRMSSLVMAKYTGITSKEESNIDLGNLLEKADLMIAEEDPQEQSLAADDISETSRDLEVSSDVEADLCEEIRFNTGCLMKYAPILRENLLRNIRNPVQRLEPATREFAVSPEAKAYVSVAREKFQKAELKLVERLGEANWQRHIGLRKRIYQSEESSSACSKFRPAQTFHDSGLGTTISATNQYTGSHTSFISSLDEEVHHSLRVPSTPPEVSAGKSFQCYICGKLQSKIRNRVEWKMHVFRDLRPYICTFSGCPHELIQFSTRNEWANHEFTYHRFEKRWSCPKCGIEEKGRQDWEKHLEKTHSLVYSGSELEVAMNLARTTMSRAANTETCLLCLENPASTHQAFIKHVGRHMEELALMALPRDVDDGSEDLVDIKSKSSISSLRDGGKPTNDVEGHPPTFPTLSSRSSRSENEPRSAEYRKNESAIKWGESRYVHIREPTPAGDSGFEGDEDEDGPSKPQRAVPPSNEIKSTMPSLPSPPLKSILKDAKDQFPEPPNPVREGVSPIDAAKKLIPPEARWTRIRRRLVNPEALEESGLRFEEYPDYDIVLKVLNQEEIGRLAQRTHEIRESRMIEMEHGGAEGEHRGAKSEHEGAKSEP